MLHNIELFPKRHSIREKKLSENPFIHPTAFVHKSKIGSWTEIGMNSIIVESIFDDFSYDAGNVQIIYTEIGKFCSIASHVRINPGNHPKERVMQHHCTYRRKLFEFDTEDDHDFFNWRKKHKCIIEHDVWIGHAAVIMPGVKIGIGAVIGSQSVVTKDIGPYEIAVGVPAKSIKKRFTDHEITKILKTEWWTWDRDIIKDRLKDFNDIKLFLEKYR